MHDSVVDIGLVFPQAEDKEVEDCLGHLPIVRSGVHVKRTATSAAVMHQELAGHY
jgi:hypothetical protein